MRIAVAMGTFAGLYGITAIATHFYVREFLLPQSRAASLELSKFEPRILADLKLLKEKPVYSVLPREKNAERFLSGFVSWQGPGTSEINNADHDRLIAMMKDHEHAVQSDEEWDGFLDDENLDQIDLSWVDQLIAYDYFDFGSNPATIDLLSRVEHSHGIARVRIASNLPFPDMRELRFAALARVAQLQLEDRLAEAPALFRHVSYLLSTTDSLMGSMISVDMLQNEKSLAERTGIPWPHIADEQIWALKRTAWAWGGIQEIRSSEGSLGAFEPYFNRTTSACASLIERIAGDELLQDYLLPTAPLEPDLREHLSKEIEFKKRVFAKCDHQDLDVFFKPITDADSPGMLGRTIPNPARIPFLRRILGLSLFLAATMNDFDLYHETPRQPASN
jgi:hypothetical protein